MGKKTMKQELPRMVGATELEKLHQDSYHWALTCVHYRIEEAEEVLQTTYLKILDGRAQYSGHSSLKSWLFGVIRLTALERRRREQLRSWLLLKWAPKNGPTEIHEQKPDASVESQQRHTALLSALKVLPTRQREILELVFYHDLTIEEAAQTLKVSIGTARQHYQRGKNRLRKVLEMGDEDG